MASNQMLFTAPRQRSKGREPIAATLRLIHTPRLVSETELRDNQHRTLQHRRMEIRMNTQTKRSLAMLLTIACACSAFAQDAATPAPTASQPTDSLRSYEKCVRACKPQVTRSVVGATEWIEFKVTPCQRDCDEKYPGFTCLFSDPRSEPVRVVQCRKK